MKAIRIHKFGPPSVLVLDEVPIPQPGKGEVLVKVAAAGVGPWDALFRENESQVSSPLPFTLGSDLSGRIEKIGPDVSDFHVGGEVYGGTNPDFIGGYAEYAVAKANMLARKPKGLNAIEAASVPVVGVTAWQMLFDYANATRGQTVLIHGGSGSVGAYAVQLASQAGLEVYATASTDNVEYVRSLGAAHVIDYRKERFEDVVPPVDIVIDTVGGETREKSVKLVKPGGILVSAVSPFPEDQKTPGIRTKFFIVEVTTERLTRLTDLIEAGKLAVHVGSVLPLEDAQKAHEMLAGAPHKSGKIVLTISGAN
jgi:NADPH:quinone reductase-like Zn-dependent oxidoreductase